MKSVKTDILKFICAGRPRQESSASIACWVFFLTKLPHLHRGFFFSLSLSFFPWMTTLSAVGFNLHLHAVGGLSHVWWGLLWGWWERMRVRVWWCPKNFAAVPCCQFGKSCQCIRKIWWSCRCVCWRTQLKNTGRKRILKTQLKLRLALEWLVYFIF